VGVSCALSFGPLAEVKIFGLSIFDTFDYVSSNIFLPVGGMFISIFTGWYLDKKFVKEEVTNGGTLRVPYLKPFIFVLRYVAPVAIGLILLNQLGVFAFL
jgi:NSS family neurotransmitter:Na+ symporter